MKITHVEVRTKWEWTGVGMRQREVRHTWRQWRLVKKYWKVDTQLPPCLEILSEAEWRGCVWQVGARGELAVKKATVTATFRIGQQVRSCSRLTSVTHPEFKDLPRAETLPAWGRSFWVWWWCAEAKPEPHSCRPGIPHPCRLDLPMDSSFTWYSPCLSLSWRVRYSEDWARNAFCNDTDD